ncbi:metalloprotease TldD [Candidatus Pandoraea novymonadis]|uniref:Metalloprotease TldD n=1 Tax=Candidatus Pandoraea novymonadis TaxID=1808959 RepID=A0ABX5FDW4_9BURK|nr:metalloprotease TldD [Candidatus Pandoraea novymonadis]PSB91871.1 Metalloprotease TldD [Candidatus Pandoraea novymonadis]
MKIIDIGIQNLATARGLLLTPHNLDEKDLQRAIGDIFTHRIDYADLYFQYTRREAWFLEEGTVKSGSFSIDQGVGVRAIVGDRTAFAYSNSISNTALKEATAATRSIAAAGCNQTRIGGNFKSPKSSACYLPCDPLNSLDANKKVGVLERIETLARSRDTRITQVMASLTGEYDVILVTRSDGMMAADVRPLVRLSITVIVESNGKREIGNSGGGARLDYDYFTDKLLERYAYEAVDSAVVKLDARPAPAGTMTVVLGPGWPGILLHEAIGHGLEGDFNRKGSSAFSGRLGERVAAKGITVVDNGTLPNRRGSLNIDDEGNTPQCTTLIEDGILKAYMQDSLNARLMKMPLTGNGRRESYATLPMPRMSNTYMLAGDKDPNEIISSVKHGLYAVNFGGGQVDITSGKFVFSTSEAYMIENGKVTYPVKEATLIGNGPESLKEVTMIGKDMALDSGVGVCGKEGQSVPVGVGQPTLRMEKMTVGGTA